MHSTRPATAHDAAAIAHVHMQSWRSIHAGIVPAPFLASLGEADRTRQWSERLELDLPVYVAEIDGDVVGFISGGPIREHLTGFDAELFAIYLLQSAQHQGSGKGLLQTLARALTERGLTSMIASVLEANASRHFYERTGAPGGQTKAIKIGGASLLVQTCAWPSIAALANARIKP